MKRHLTIFLIVALFLASCSLSPKSIHNGHLSAEETVKYYYERYGKKDLSGMNQVLYKKFKLEDMNFDEIVSVNLISCTEEKDPSKIHFGGSWYDCTPYEYTLVRVRYSIEFKKGTDQPIENGEHDCDYYLAKKTKESDWIIVMAGLG